MKYNEVDGYSIGFADLTITEVSRHCVDFFSEFSLLITCLDSDPRLRHYGESLRTSKPQWNIRIVGESIWVGSENVRELLLDPSILSHFDEMYLVREHPTSDFQVKEIFTTDRANFADVIPATFLEMLRAASASRYLSDGSGLNFACEDLDLVRRLEKIEAMILGALEEHQG